MKKLKKTLTAALSLILCIVLLAQSVIATETNAPETYVKEIKLIYADSLSDAKKQLPEGYRLVSNNLNASTGKEGVYICYSTTTDPSEAITDIKVMHEEGGFERTDFKSTLDNAVDGVYSLAQELTVAVAEFKENYEAGIVGAVYAKDALNYFQYDADTLLGDYMVSGKGTAREYGEMILMCHEDIINPILSLLALGVQKDAGNNWIDKLADIDPSAYGAEHDMEYRTRATKLRPILQQFNDVYCYVLGYYDETYTYADLDDENDKEFFAEMAENKDLLVLIKTILESYNVGVDSSWGEWGATVADLFTIGLNSPINIYDIYALLDCLTPGQEVMLRLTGPYNFIIGAQSSEEAIEKARAELQTIDPNEKVPIWDGINLDLFETEVGLTTEASRSIAAGRQYDIFSQDIDTLKQHYRNTAQIVSSALTIATSAVLVVKCGMPLLSMGFAKLGCTTIASTIAAFAAKALVVNILFYTGLTFMIAGIICAIIVTFFLEDIINRILEDDHERTTIPKYMVDEYINKEGFSTYAYYKVVENVKTDKQLGLDKDENESGSDINANEGYRWMAIYTSNKSSIGNPIKADFKVQTNTGETPAGYTNLRLFGEVNAVNLNSYAASNPSKYDAIYLFYAQDVTVLPTSDQLYISSIRVETASHETVAKTNLLNKGYIPFEHDFSVRDGESTFIGYKLTTHASDAVKDIRVLYNFGGSGITFGQLNYGSMGKIGKFDLMVSSSSANPAPPVVKLKVFHYTYVPPVDLGFEPVNEFSGGKAQHLGKNLYCLYFLPETTFTEGPDYLAGIETDVYYYNNYTERYGYEYTKRYYDADDKYGNSYETYKKMKGEKHNELFFDFNVTSKYNMPGRHANWSDSDNVHVLSYKYTTTKNPYRALYGVAATTLSGLSEFNDHISFGGVGHVLSPVEFSTNSYYYSFEDFFYSWKQNRDETYDDGCKALAYWNPQQYQQQPVHSFADIENQDITQTFFSKNQNAMYLAGYQDDKMPLSPDDIILSKEKLDKKDVPENFIPVYYMIGNSSDPANIAPTNDEAKIGSELTWGGFGSKDLKAKIYADPVYMYYRSEKTVNGQVVAQGSLKEGKYISGIFITSREEIREASLNENADLKCEHISKSVVENALLSAGATITYNIHINTNFCKDDSFKNANYTFLGISRSDDINEAIRDIRLYIAEPGEVPKATVHRMITYQGRSFPVEYSLVSKASLTEQGNKGDSACKKERQVYVYVSSHPALGDPITQIKMSDWYSFDDYEPIRTMEDMSFIAAYNQNKKDGGATIFADKDYFNYGNHISFMREGGEAPYIQSVMISANDDSGKDAIAALLEKGYTDIVRQDFNKDAGGDYIYIGMKRTNNESDAIYDLMLYNKKDPPQTKNGYTLVSKVDLNKGAAGKYIYLYEKRTPSDTAQTPLTDLLAAGKDAKDRTITVNGQTVKQVITVNQDGEKQDLNQNCGPWSDYIYLVKEYGTSSTYTGSIFGPGSIIAIAVFGLVGLSTAGYFLLKKKKKQRTPDQAI